MFILTVQQNESAMHIHLSTLFGFPSHLSHHRSLSRVPMVYTRFSFSQFRSVQSLSPVWLCDPMNCSTPGLPVHYHLPEFKLTSIESVMPSSHRILCRPLNSCPQSLPAPESFPMSQLFTWGGQSTAVSSSASFLPKKTQGWSPLEWTGWISWQSKGLSRGFSNTTVQNHQFFSTQPSSQSNSCICTQVLEKP